MSRTVRTLFCALCLLAGGLATVPASAQPGPGAGPIPFDHLKTHLPMIRLVVVVGAGETATEALDNALGKLEEDYTILRYREIDAGCPLTQMPPIDDPEPGPGEEPDVEYICWSKVRALVLVKAALTS